MGSRVGLGVLALAVLLSLGCQEAQSEAPKKHEKAIPKVAVSLPPKPNLDAILKAPRMHPDGSMTVTGLLLDRTKLLGTHVTVKGQIRELSPDCPFLTNPKEIENRPRPGEHRRVCRSVFLTMADGPVSPKSLTVVMYNPYFHPYFKPGMELVVKGRYDTQGAGFVRPRDGLLIVDDIDGVVNYAVDKEGVFYTDPAEIQRVNAEALAPPEPK